ncbi:hypothetical protein Tco_1231219 [Tanacetum coccineum]
MGLIIPVRVLSLDVFDCNMVSTCIGLIIKNLSTSYGSSGYFYFFRLIRRECGILYPASYSYRFYFVEVPVVPEVGTAAVSSPAGVLELDAHSLSEADPAESSLPPVSIAPMVSPFLCLDDLESDTKLPERRVSPTPLDAMLARWRSRVASRSSSPTTSTPEIPTAPITPTPSAIVAPYTDIISHVDTPPRVRRRRAILIRLGQDISIALRYTSYHLDHFTSGSSLDHSSSDHSSADHSPADHTSGHPIAD